jgi:phosphoribosylanthranilate isomerase
VTKIKICGNTNSEDVKLAIDLKADFIGFIFTESKRKLSLEKANEIIQSAGPFPGYVGVFANQQKNEVESIAKALHLKSLQFHGDETSRYCQYFMEQGYRVIKSFRVKDALSLKRLDEYNVSAFLFDTYSREQLGGTGSAFDWSVIEHKPYIQEKLFLAGGLTPQNVKEAIQKVRPYAVDVASGIEKSPGKKDPELLKQFISAVREIK